MFNFNSKCSWSSLVTSFILVALVRVSSAIFMTKDAFTWYDSLIFPALTPCNYTYGIVWGILYFIMILALCMLLETPKTSSQSTTLWSVFTLQSIAQAVWSYCFFGLHSVKYGYWALVATLILYVIFVMEAHKVSKKAAYILIPQALWLSFAVFHSYQLMMLN